MICYESVNDEGGDTLGANQLSAWASGPAPFHSLRGPWNCKLPIDGAKVPHSPWGGGDKMVQAWLTLLGRPVGQHGSLPHDVVALAHLPHHGHGVLLALVMRSSTWGHVVLLGGRLLVHHGT